MKSIKTYQIVLMTFFGMFGSILIGFIFFGTSIFIPIRTSFQFITAGFIGVLFFSLLEYKSIKEQIFSMLFILIMHLIIFTGRYLSITFIIRDIFYLGGLFLSIKLYHQFIKINPQIKYYLRSLAWVVIYGLLNSLSGIIIFVINVKGNFPSIDFIYSMAKYGILIGLGIGLGIDFYLQYKIKLFSLLKLKTA